MELWFSEQHTPYVRLSIKVERQLYSGQSDYQRIDVLNRGVWPLFDPGRMYDADREG